MTTTNSLPNSVKSHLAIKVYWGDILYDTVLCDTAGQVISIGRTVGSTFVMDLGRGALRTSLPLVTFNKDKTATLRFDDVTEGHARLGTKLITLQQLREDKKTPRDASQLYELILGQQDKASIVIGHVSFDLEWSEKKEIIPRPIITDKKSTIIAASIFSLSILVLTFLELPTLQEEDKPKERVVQILPNKRLPQAKAAMGERKKDSGGAMKQEVGKVATTPPNPVKPTKPSQEETLKNLNLGNLVSNLSNLTKAPTTPTSNEKIAALSQDKATGSGQTAEGIKQGAQGKSIGLGRTVGQGEGGFQGTGKLGLSGNSLEDNNTGRGVINSDIETGGLDRSIIDQIIRRRQDRIRLCYTRQLNFNPKLSGKVTVKFSIGKDGAVMTSQIVEDTMKNEAVNNCIRHEVQSWSFPKPKGGVVVKVDYPFVFEAGN